ncbi:MAG: quercetin 2,3-dioxygenase [Acidobacteriota bacterium]|jgi:redox-sensitive bicupin YhaK (pirin superfamily)|nr:quercetin 2,3-dioxygenase [Acidobacteriota bacterium]
MITIRKAEERGHFDFGWLNTYHTFSFGEYYDPRNMGFRSLRVINEDYVHPGRGFPTHGHRDMEIITYVLEGGLGHKDSMGNGSIIRPGDVQRMSAGTGVTHSEANPSKEESVHLLQIWILPDKMGVEPSYEEKKFDDEGKRGRLRLVVSPDGQEGSVTIHQDARVYATVLDAAEQVAHELKPGRHAWIQVARGAIEVNGQSLKQGDGASISEEQELTITGQEPSEVLLFDLN